MKRSLVLAGGGMRVAWQAGVVRALAEEGIDFHHVDGTSGGILTAGMLLSGVSPEDMCRRWLDVDVKDFGSALPVGDYLKGPWSLPAIGDADGILNKVFPALGVDADAVRRHATAPDAVEGSFNVVEFTEKRCHAIDAKDIDAELMAAGMSLPIFLTPLRRDGRIWTDAVWVRDANVAEALRRGADEVWLIWCIGNSPYWGDGPLEQYVHMIEMSAMGALLADFEAAAATGRHFVLHVIKPEHPLPLDPEFYLNRVDAGTLIGMGYRDARSYLDSLQPEGVAKDAGCTAMTEPPPGVRFNDTLRGDIGGSPLTFRATVVLPTAAVAGPPRFTGYVDHAGVGGRVFVADGRVESDGDQVTYRGKVRLGGSWQELTVTRTLHDDPGPDAWMDSRRAELALGDTRTEVRMTLADAAGLLASVEPVGAHGFIDRAGAAAGFAANGLRELLHRY
ncbi:patatin-like phospholipase family protein [Paenarthrobacter ureafaciens]|uniref:patatin-like phospholipase family protein n=2 Tax=Paenarthrobacter ureafaciens TaxID=37931 RepID=UPI00140B90FB|nr:patatin-like phospholipase family protein [Paenarthrobacter ureafaciens]MCX8454018.1 patatin-like phospholipase family protein [Paenarthrobacter ureafaciens]MCY0972088.1 patatin-like phospholipase family protein [Paenarthrobacter ureafaciens]